MTNRIVVIGGGEHARVVLSALKARGELARVAGFVDIASCEPTVARFGVTRLGTDEDLHSGQGLDAVLGFGGLQSATRRLAVVEKLGDRVAGWATVIHPSAAIADDVAAAQGTVIFAGAVINTGAVLGPHCIVNTGAIIEHDVRLGAHVQVSPGAVLGGGAQVGDQAYIGLGARIRDHVSIGAGAVVAMGAVVVRDVEPGAHVQGVPAR